ncbi:hypothetical protein [Chitinophaga solisilvae]|uniref:hypothetical protein n=1 Tax=Chitinophaga solisilvae TaxID=1233460 RepID=UPI001370047F|nr:hypothetical protein [Chitinophaga solisilvae]
MNRYIKLLFIFGCSVLAYCILTTLLLANYAGNNPLNKLKINAANYISIFPEGWSFFTKTVKEPSLSLYKVENGMLKREDLRAFQSRFLWGANRNNRLLSVEVSNVIRKVNAAGMRKMTYLQNIKFRENINDYFSADTLLYNNVTADEQLKLLRGKYVIIIEDFRPWSILKRKDEFEVKQKISLIPVLIK